MTYSKSGTGAETLLQIAHPEGFTAREGSAWIYKYLKTDHVGSTRVVLAARKVGVNIVMQVEQTTDYYPFGLAHSLNNLHLNKYLYGGKEIQDARMGNLALLGLYDFHARYYNPVLGRWFNIDPALQTTNPYLYCGNNPMMFVDPNGKSFILTAIIMGAFINAMTQSISGNINSQSDYFRALAIGAVAGAAGFGAGGLVAGAVGTTGFFAGAITGAAGGFAGGFTGGFGNALAGGSTNPLKAGLTAGAMGAATGAALGGIAGGISASKAGLGFWRGTGTLEYGTGVYADNPSIVHNYDPTLNDEMLKDRTYEMFKVKEGDFGIEKLTTAPDGPYAVTTNGRMINTKTGEYVGGYTSRDKTFGARPQVHIAPHIAGGKDIHFRAIVGHELIHAYHMSIYPEGRFSRSESEFVAYRYTYDIYNNAGMTSNSLGVMNTARSLNFWGNAIQDYSLYTPFFVH